MLSRSRDFSKRRCIVYDDVMFKARFYIVCDDVMFKARSSAHTIHP